MYIFHSSFNDRLNKSDLHKKGKFGNTFFFSSEKYTMGGDYFYKLEIVENCFCEVYKLEEATETIKQVAFVLEISEETATDLLTEEIDSYSLFSDAEEAAENSWYIQEMQSVAASEIGYVGVISSDEQGAVYIINMTNSLLHKLIPCF